MSDGKSLSELEKQLDRPAGWLNSLEGEGTANTSPDTVLSGQVGQVGQVSNSLPLAAKNHQEVLILQRSVSREGKLMTSGLPEGDAEDVTLTIWEDMLKGETIIRGPRGMFVRLSVNELVALPTEYLEYLFKEGAVQKVPALKDLLPPEGTDPDSDEWTDWAVMLQGKLETLKNMWDEMEVVRREREQHSEAQAATQLSSEQDSSSVFPNLLSQPELPGMEAVGLAPTSTPQQAEEAPSGLEVELPEVADPAPARDLGTTGSTLLDPSELVPVTQLSSEQDEVTSQALEEGGLLSDDGIECIKQAVQYMSIGDVDATMNCLFTLDEADVQPTINLLGKLSQVALAVGTHHSLKRLMQIEKRRARMRDKLIRTVAGKSAQNTAGE